MFISSFRTRWGAWVDDHPRMVCTPEYLDRVVEVGYDQLRIMVDSSHPDWDRRYTDAQLQILRRLAMVERDIELTFVFWPIPHKRTLERMAEDLRRMVGMTGVTTLSAELEGLMLQRIAVQYGWDIVSAKSFLFDFMCEISEEFDITVEGTTHPGHPEAQPQNPNKPSRGWFASQAHRMFWQVYPTRHDWQGRKVAWDGRYGPIGRAQDAERLAKLSASYGQPRPCFGTPVWDQEWPGHDVEEALELHYQTLMRHNPDIIADWMSGNIVGRFHDRHVNPRMAAKRKELIERTKIGGKTAATIS
jgi:hypothetical protein